MKPASHAPAGPLLEIRGLVKRYGGLLVTDHVDLDVRQGEIHAVIGPNGAGKTTLVNQIVGEVAPDGGAIVLNGVDVTHHRVAQRARAGIGRSYQINSVIAEFSVLENVLLSVQAAMGHAWHFWQPVVRTQALVERAMEVLELLGLADQRERIAGSLSYGQQRQLELALALATRPRLLLLDEPMAGLGPAESESMTGIIDGLRAQFGILLIEHDMHAVFALAQRVSVLVYGRVAFSGLPAEARQSALVREAYLGDEELA